MTFRTVKIWLLAMMKRHPWRCLLLALALPVFGYIGCQQDVSVYGQTGGAPFAVHRAGTTAKFDIDVTEHRVYSFSLRYQFNERSKEDRLRVLKLVGGFEKKPNGESLVPGAPVELRIRIDPLDQAPSSPLLDKHVKKLTLTSWGAGSFAQRLVEVPLLPGRYQVTIESLADVAELADTTVHLSYGFDSKSGPLPLKESTARVIEEERIYRTGLEAEKGYFSVSPDGRQIAFDTNLFIHGLRIMDLADGTVQVIPEPEGRSYGFPDWSPDGHHLAVVSTAIKENQSDLDNMDIVLLDVGTWKSRRIAAGDGVKFYPSFAADGRSVYYTKGIKRTNGKTVASRYDLFVIDLASGMEKRLTEELFYAMGKGSDDGASLLFNALDGKTYGERRDELGNKTRSTVFRYDKIAGSIEPVEIDQRNEIFEFTAPKRNANGDLHFVATKVDKKSDRKFHWFVFRANAEGKNPVALAEILGGLQYDIVRTTGDIYVMDKSGTELIFRKVIPR